ncbi:MAG TPA: hypothetical protein VGG78_00120 [Gemmatimonadaceae bacterium]
MYTTCLFCNGDLGRNEVIEAFPVGRRLAFDAAKGRLWVVCRRCERWNLTPLEERWEAIEECERAFRATKLRVSTDEIGLARLKEGLELVRIGAPQRPEMAAWRYGDQFGRRRRRYYGMVAGGVAVMGVVVVAGPMLGLVSVGALNPAMNLFNAGRALYRSRTIIHVPGPDGASLRTRLSDLDRVRLTADDEGPVLRVPVAQRRLTRSAIPWYQYDRKPQPEELRGDDAIRAAGALLPRMNQRGGSANDVQRAVEYLEEAATPEQLYRHAAGMIAKRGSKGFGPARGSDLLKNLPVAGRLALEMASHEDVERRALEGELHVLEEAWRQAEEIAGIADDMFVPESVDTELARLKRERDDRPTG